jgi:ABC-type Fe3+-hydroxamate transport system substrate-binding protein
VIWRRPPGASGRDDDAEQAGERIASEIETRHRRATAAARGRVPVTFAYLIWRKPWMTVNGDTFVSALLSDAGGRNVFAERADRYPAIEAGDLALATPDMVLLSTEPFPFKESHADELSALTGLARERFRIVDGERLSWHGSRTPAGIDYAESVIEQARSA